MKIKKLLGVLLAIMMVCVIGAGCAPKEEKPVDPYAGFGTEKFRVTFETDGLVTFPTICFNEEFSKEHIAVKETAGLTGKAYCADIKLPDPNNVWYALGIGFANTNRYDGNFKDIKKIAFKYTSTVDYTKNVTDELSNITLQIAIKSVKATETDEQEVYSIEKVVFPIKLAATAEVFVIDVPADIQDKINASKKNLYFDWFMLAIEETGADDFKSGKIAFDDIAFFA